MNTNFKVGMYIEDEKTYLSLEFIKDEKYKITIPKISLSTIEIEKEDVVVYICNCIPFTESLVCKISLDVVTKDQILYSVEDLNCKPPQELTIPEIEAKLGHKIIIKGE